MHIDYEPFKTNKSIRAILCCIFIGIPSCFWLYYVLAIEFKGSIFFLLFVFTGIYIARIFWPRKFLVRFDDQGILIEIGKRRKMMFWGSIYSVASVKNIKGQDYWLIMFRKLSKAEKWKIVNIYGMQGQSHGGLIIARTYKREFHQQVLEIDAFIREHAQRWEPQE